LSFFLCPPCPSFCRIPKGFLQGLLQDSYKIPTGFL
jgi:hypothetical protein